MTRVRVHHGAAIGFCYRGQRRFFHAHGLDFLRFLREGFDESEFDGIEDGNLAKTIAQAKAEEEHSGRREKQ